MGTRIGITALDHIRHGKYQAVLHLGCRFRVVSDGPHLFGHIGGHLAYAVIEALNFIIGPYIKLSDHPDVVIKVLLIASALYKAFNR